MQLNVLNDLAGAMKASDGKKSTIMEKINHHAVGWVQLCFAAGTGNRCLGEGQTCHHCTVQKDQAGARGVEWLFYSGLSKGMEGSHDEADTTCG